MRHIVAALILSCGLSGCARAEVDTVKNAPGIEDATIYDYFECDPETSGEDCHRYNSGEVETITVGLSGLDNSRAIIQLPGWDGSLPDSSTLLLYCLRESDPTDRRIFAYPLTRPVIIGTEFLSPTGAYPVDSGVTWNHVWLETTTPDSLSWDTPGGDFDTSVACTMLVTGDSSYFALRHFERVLRHLDSVGARGIILINENVFPANNSAKTFVSADVGSAYGPTLLLYRTETAGLHVRRRRTLNRPRKP